MNAPAHERSLDQSLKELLGLPWPCHLSTGTVMLSPITLAGLPDLIELLNLNTAISDDGESTDDRLEVALALVALMSGLDPADIAALSDSDFTFLEAACRAANPSIFGDAVAPRARGTGAAGRHGLRSIETSVALLVERGHRLEDIKRYTLAQIEQLSLAHARLAAEQRINDLMIARAAAASEKGYKSIAQSLQQALARLGG